MRLNGALLNIHTTMIRPGPPTKSVGAQPRPIPVFLARASATTAMEPQGDWENLGFEDAHMQRVYQHLREGQVWPWKFH